MRLNLAPRQREFYELFAEAGRNVVGIAELAERRFRDYPDSSVSQEQVKALESEGDRLTRELINLLNTQYVTPLDREDIYALAGAIDDVADHVEHASDLLGLYKVEAPMEQAIVQCGLLVAASRHLADALGKLRGLEGTRPHQREIKRLEDEGDRVVRDAVASLFEDDEVDPRVIIRWKDIFEALEEALDACDRAGHILGNIVLKAA
jgi:uncharacterized protein